jgi:hypothetical protein
MAEILIITAGMGQNIPVFYKKKYLPKQFEKYDYIIISEKTLYENFTISKFRKLASCLFFKGQNHISFANLGKIDIRINRRIKINYFEKNPVWSEKAKIGIFLSMKSIFKEFPILYENNNADDPPVGSPFLFQFNKNDPTQKTDVSNY